MRAVVMTAVGGPEVLKLVELPDPKLEGEHDVLVRLRAAGVNPVDYKLRSRGTIGGSLPAVLGWDGSGVVERTAARGHSGGHWRRGLLLRRRFRADAGDVRRAQGRTRGLPGEKALQPELRRGGGGAVGDHHRLGSSPRASSR